MMTKHLRQARPIGSLIVLLPLTAVAQSLDPSSLHELDDDSGLTYQNLTIDEIEDMALARDGEVIGEVEEVLGDEANNIVALVIEIDGGQGIGDRERVVPIEALQITQGSDHVVTLLTDEELSQLPQWED